VKVAAFVQAVESRRDMAEWVRNQALRGGCDSAEVLYQAPGTKPWDHFFNTFRAMEASDAELVIRFEDDCEISPHVGHNCRTWNVISRPRFGVGLLYSPPTCIHDYMYCERPTAPLRTRWFAGAVAQLWRRSDLTQHIAGMQELLPEFSQGHPFDILVSAHCHDHGWELYTHNPCIVEHVQNVESAIGNSRNGDRTTGGAYNPRFRR